MAGFQIRPYQPADFNACLNCFESNIPTYFTRSEAADFRIWLGALGEMKDENSVGVDTAYFVIVSANQIIGCGGFGLSDNCRDVVFAWGLIHRSYHNRGYGKALAEFRLNIIKERFPGADIVLDTTQHSYRFFERLGFLTEKITLNFYAADLHRYDMRFVAEAL